MKLSNLLSISAILALLFGLSFLFVPATALASYGITDTTAAHRYAIQWFGLALIAFAALNWTARGAGESDARRGVVLGNLVHAAGGLVLALIGVLGGLVNTFGWVSVAIYALLAFGFARHAMGRGADVARAAA